MPTSAAGPKVPMNAALSGLADGRPSRAKTNRHRRLHKKQQKPNAECCAGSHMKRIGAELTEPASIGKPAAREPAPARSAAVILHAGRPQAGQAVLVDGPLPRKEFVDRELIALTSLLEAQ